MNRRGFFGLLGKLLAVGTALSVAPEILGPLANALPETIYSGSSAVAVSAEVVFTYGKPDWALAS